MTDSKPTKTPHVLAEVLVAHQYPHDGPQHAVGTTYELPASDFEAFLGMGYVRRCERPDNSLPGDGGRPPHVEPHRRAAGSRTARRHVAAARRSHTAGARAAAENQADEGLSARCGSSGCR